MKKYFLFFFFPYLLFSQDETKTFNLKDGATVVGQIVNETDSTLTLKTTFGQININKSDILKNKISNSNLFEKEDIRFDFVIDQTALAQWHSFAWQTGLNIETPIWLLVSGSSYFVVDAIANKINLNRFNVQNMRQSHINGAIQGFLIGSYLSEIKSLNKKEIIVEEYYDIYGEKFTNSYEREVYPQPWVQAAYLLSSGMGIYKTFSSYNESLNNPNEGLTTLTNNLEMVSLTTLPLAANAFFPNNLLDKLEDKTTFWLTLSLAPSLTTKYWAPKLFSNYNLTLGDAMMVDNIMWYSFGTGVLSNFIIQTENRSLFFGILTASEIAGLYYGLEFANNKGFTFSDARHISTFATAGSTAGFGLFLVLTYNQSGSFDDGMRLMGILTSAGLWGGFIYGLNTIENDKSASLKNEKYNLTFHPENIFASNLVNKISYKPIHVPILNFNYNF